MEQQIALDRIDRQIIQALIDDGRASVEKVAEAVGLSPTPARRRIRNLEKIGVIKGYSAVIDPEKCGLDLSIYVLVTLHTGESQLMTQFEAAINQMPEIQRCDLIAGPNCYILTLRVPNMKFYNRYLRDALTKLPGVYAIESRMVIGPVKDTAQLPLSE